tara:strand:- start:871 stop:1821 length:951 start_codon:yes stop_codon:yes gene_type:complete
MLKYFYYYLIKSIANIVKISNIKNNFFDKIFFNIGLIYFEKTKRKYRDVKSLFDVEYKVFSQNGEDGILDYIITCLNIKNPNFFEIGVGDYRESNTRFIYQKYHSKGVIIDCLPNLKQKIKHHVNLWKGHLKVIEDMVTSENIENILKENLNFELDIFSIDIDGIDYWIIDKLPKNISKIFIAEYNSNFGHELHVSVPNINDFNRTKYHHSNLCYGMSLRALIKLMEKKNFYFLGTNLQKNNAFFISKDFLKEKYFPNIELSNSEDYCNSNIRESRNQKGSLTYLTGKRKIEAIQECEVIDLKDDNYKKTLIKDLI